MSKNKNTLWSQFVVTFEFLVKRFLWSEVLIMDNLRFYLDHWYVVPKAILRLCLILINNVYCIPTYVVWMVLLSPLRKIHPDTYWKIEGYFFHWLLAMVSMWSWSAGYEVMEMGDDISNCLDEKTLVIANHQSTADVPLLMALFNTKKQVLPNIMWIMDKHFKYTNFGIVSVIHQDFFIMAGKQYRDRSLSDLITHLLLSYIPRKRKWTVLFPEGGFLRKRKGVSQKYAMLNNLPILNNVSLPRVGALQAIMQTIGPQGVANNNSKPVNDKINKLDRLSWVLDITIAYPNGEPLDLPTIILGHKQPCQTIMFYRLYRCDELPHDTEALTHWLYSRFEEKEKMLDSFYKTGTIPVSHYSSNPIPPNVIAQDYLRFIILHIFFITSTYLHLQFFMAAYNYCNYLMY